MSGDTGTRSLGMVEQSAGRECGRSREAVTPRRGAFKGSVTSPTFSLLLRRAVGTPPLRITRSAMSGGGGGEASIKNSKISCTSDGTSIYDRWRGPIRKNIIGHGSRYGVSVRGQQFFARSALGGAGWALALFDQPARKHGASVLFDPLIQQSANLLPEIGGVAETRKFVALKRVARSGEKKLPRRLRWGTGHVGLLETDGCKVTNQ